MDSQRRSYDLHPIVRAYAYDRLANPQLTHLRLRDYFSSLANTTNITIQDFESITPTIELYHHTVKSRNYDDAWRLYRDRLRDVLYYRFGAYPSDIQLLRELLDKESMSPHGSDIRAKTWIMIYLAMDYERTGQLRLALQCSSQAVRFSRESYNLSDTGAALTSQGSIQRNLGHLSASKESFIQAIEIFETSIPDPNWRGIVHREYAYALINSGQYEEAAQHLDFAERAYSVNKRSFIHGLSLLWLYRSELADHLGNPEEAKKAAEEGLQLAERGHYVREIAEANFRLGILLIKSKNLQRAEELFQMALMECRRMNLADLESSVLLGLAHVQLSSIPLRQEMMREAYNLAIEALAQADRYEYRLVQSDIHSFLAEWHLSRDVTEARKHAEYAKERAWCDGPEFSSYQSGLDKAEQLLRLLNLQRTNEQS